MRHFCIALIFAFAMASPGIAQQLLSQRLLIVAPRALQVALAPFVAHKQQQMPTSIALLDEILETTSGADDAEKLKRYLYERWKTEPLGYLLLVGDADVLPVRYMVLDRISEPAFNYAFYPSDLYYADLVKKDGTFEDWNGRRDGFHSQYFGEVRGEANKTDPINFDAIDYLPDLAVGRWPVSEVVESKNMVAKSIAYENAVIAGTKPGWQTAALLSVSGWVDSRGVMDGIAQQLGPKWSIEKRYFSSPGQPIANPPSEASLLQLLNDGIGIAMHAGHGHDDGWDQCLSLNSLDSLHNADRLPIVISAGCSTARFAALPPYEPYQDSAGIDHAGTNNGEQFSAPPAPPGCYQSGSHNPPGLGEQLLRRGPDGAIAYIGCNTGSQPCGLALLTGFAKTYSQLKRPRLGDCWNGAVTYYYDDQRLADLKPDADWYPPSIFFQAMKFMCFGDPSLLLP